MQSKILLLLLLSCIPEVSQPQDIKYPVLQGFRIRNNYPVYRPDNLWDFIDGAADTYLSYGFADLHVAEYKKRKEIIKLEIYRHSDHTNAFGIYSSERSPSFSFMNIGSQGYKADGSVNFFKGNYYVKIRTYSKKPKTLHSAESLAMAVAGMLEGDATMPEMISLLPPEGKKINEESYINESVLGHSFLNKAFKAQYQIGSDNFAIFIIGSDTPETAAKILNTYVASTGIDPVASGEDRYIIKDGYNGTIFLARKDNKIVIVSGLAQDQAEIADKYTSEILK